MRRALYLKRRIGRESFRPSLAVLEMVADRGGLHPLSRRGPGGEVGFATHASPTARRQPERQCSSEGWTRPPSGRVEQIDVVQRQVDDGRGQERVWARGRGDRG